MPKYFKCKIRVLRRLSFLREMLLVMSTSRLPTKEQMRFREAIKRRNVMLKQTFRRIPDEPFSKERKIIQFGIPLAGIAISTCTQIFLIPTVMWVIFSQLNETFHTVQLLKKKDRKLSKIAKGGTYLLILTIFLLFHRDESYKSAIICLFASQTYAVSMAFYQYALFKTYISVLEKKAFARGANLVFLYLIMMLLMSYRRQNQRAGKNSQIPQQMQLQKSIYEQIQDRIAYNKLITSNLKEMRSKQSNELTKSSNETTSSPILTKQ